MPLSWILALLGCGAGDPGAAPPPIAEPDPAPAACGRWTSPETWPGGRVPEAGDCVTIPAHTCVLLDAPEVDLAALTIEGSLLFEDRDVVLRADLILVQGLLQVGTEAAPFTSDARIELGAAHSVALPAADAGGSSPQGAPLDVLWGVECPDGVRRIAEDTPPRALLVMGGGALELHGEPAGPAWTPLAAPAGPAEADPTLLPVADAAWHPGDRIGVTSSDFDAGQAEELVVAATGPDGIRAVTSLAHRHHAGVERPELDPAGRGVPVHAEVARLTRNIQVVGVDLEAVPLAGECAQECEECGESECSCPPVLPTDLAFHGGTIQLMRGCLPHEAEHDASHATVPSARVDGVELVDMGRYGELQAHPLYFHELGDAAGSYVRRSVVRRSSNRAFGAKGTSNLVLEDNVAWDVIGSAFWLPDGTTRDRTRGNVLARNLAASVHACNPLDEGDGRKGPGAFYLRDVDNTLVGNVAAGFDFAGFYVDIRNGDPCDATGPDPTCTMTFDGNVAHSGQDGFYANEHHRADQAITGFVAHHLHGRGLWLRSEGTTTVDGFAASDCGTAIYPASHAFLNDLVPGFELTNSLIVGEGSDPGAPAHPDAVAYGRSVPLDEDGDPRLMMGVEVYEGRLTVRDVVFADFPGDRAFGGDLVPAAAFGRHRDFFFYDDDPANAVERVTLVDALPVWFDDPETDSGGTASVMLYDVDGSLTGTPASWVVASHAFYDLPGRTTFVPEWNVWRLDAGTAASFMIEWADPTIPEPTAWGLARTAVFTRIDDGVPTEAIVADLSKDGRHVQQGINVLSGTTVRVAWEGKGGAPVIGFDEVDLYLRHGPPGTTLDVEVPLASPGWAGTVSVGSTSTGLAEPLPPEQWSFDPLTSMLRVHLAIGGDGEGPRAGVQTVVHVDP